MSSPSTDNYQVALRGVLSFSEDGRTFRHIGNTPRFIYSVCEDGSRIIDLWMDEITVENVRWVTIKSAGILRFEPTNHFGPHVRFQGYVRMRTGKFSVIRDDWSVIEATLEVQPQSGDPWTVTPNPKEAGLVRGKDV